jgi:Na+/H+ antiporter NhaC
MSSFWFPIVVGALALVPLIVTARSRDTAVVRRAAALTVTCLMAANLAGAVQTHQRAREEIREEATALARPPAALRDGAASDFARQHREHRLQEVVHETEALRPWMLILSSLVLGMALTRVIDGGRALDRNVGERP